jgi:hypothetical protein
MLSITMVCLVVGLTWSVTVVIGVEDEWIEPHDFFSSWGYEMYRQFISNYQEKVETGQKWEYFAIFIPIDQGRISGRIHGHPKFSRGPAMPCHAMPCKQPPLKQPYCCFRGWCLQGRQTTAVLLPPWIPHSIRSWPRESRSWRCCQTRGNTETLVRVAESGGFQDQGDNAEQC